MEKRELTCICCPIGCQISVTLDDGKVVDVKGNTCKRGEDYAREETVRPVRVVTTTVRAKDGTGEMVSVKTCKPVPKDKILDCMKEINAVQVTAPVTAGDIILENVAGTGVDVVATQSMKSLQ